MLEKSKCTLKKERMHSVMLKAEEINLKFTVAAFSSLSWTAIKGFMEQNRKTSVKSLNFFYRLSSISATISAASQKESDN